MLWHHINNVKAAAPCYKIAFHMLYLLNHARMTASQLAYQSLSLTVLTVLSMLQKNVLTQHVPAADKLPHPADQAGCADRLQLRHPGCHHAPSALRTAGARA